MEEKRQRQEARKAAVAAMTSTVESVVTSVVTEETSAVPVTTSAEVKEAAVKPLKIEVHATAMHHEQLVPKVAHSQNHDFGHNQAVSTLRNPFGVINFFICLPQLRLLITLKP